MEYQRIGSIQLGQETDKHFILNMLPDNYEEKVYEHDRFYSCKCKNLSNQYIGEKNWKILCDKIIEEFGDNLMDIDSITSEGVHFVVYLRKTDEHGKED